MAFVQEYNSCKTWGRRNAIEYFNVSMTFFCTASCNYLLKKLEDPVTILMVFGKESIVVKKDVLTVSICRQKNHSLIEFLKIVGIVVGRTVPLASPNRFQRPSLRAFAWLATIFVASIAAVN